LIAGFIFAGMRQHSYLNSAKTIIGIYDGREPFSAFLKKYFAAHKKYGSTDRKQIATLCYDFFRLGKALPGKAIEEKLITATFLCERSGNDFLNFHKPGWNELMTGSLSEKIISAGLVPGDIFPWKEELSDGIEINSFSLSFLIQPDLFLRIRPGRTNSVIKKLDEAGLPYEMKAGDCIALPNGSKLDPVIELDKEAVVQDINSQQVLNFLKDPPAYGIRRPVSVWDCCAASGGKSILVCDILQTTVELTVSDIRESILSNLKKRFSAAGIRNYHSFIADLSVEKYSSRRGRNDQPYSIIICDVPCTGSGTWSRTPEQLYFFKKEMIDDYAGKQRKIVSNTIPQLKEDGLFVYVTCSVFRKENEEMVNFIKEKFHLQLLQMEFLKGFDKKADSMFVAQFLKK
jgi:16S rRNA (cytosine967-C5)-methyltransferase